MTSNSIYACITEDVIRDFKPTFLYIKRHSVTSLLYFGKTIRDPLKYNGSGSYWKNHIKKHGEEFIETIWTKRFDDIYELVEFALFFSDFFQIVRDKSWGNKMVEHGLSYTSNEITSMKISRSRKGSTLYKNKNDFLDKKILFFDDSLVLSGEYIPNAVGKILDEKQRESLRVPRVNGQRGPGRETSLKIYPKMFPGIKMVCTERNTPKNL